MLTLSSIWILSLLGGTLAAPPFEWGVATAAYQVEGATSEDGRGQSIWDTFASQGHIARGETGAVGDDMYHKYPVDIALMKQLGIKNLRLSLAWPRIYPQGSGTVNQAGLSFYNKLIDSLLAANIEPYVTLYHWDLPQTLQDRYGGWAGDGIVDDFANYAATVFTSLGEKVRYYTTFNEPWSFCFLGYGSGSHAPGVSGQAWSCVYHVLAAHAAAVKRLRAINPAATVSMNLNVDWAEPASASAADRDAAVRFLDYMVGIFADPVYKGDYPESVNARVPASTLPRISPALAADLNGSMDIFALNHYTSQWVRDSPGAQGSQGQGQVDYQAGGTAPDGTLIGPAADSDWLHVVPWGFRNILGYIKHRYSPVEIFVTENGVDVPGEASMSKEQALDDQFRINFFRTYLDNAVQAALNDGVPLSKYFVWSLLDNFEWVDGYGKRFGIVYVDYPNNQTRYPKASAAWLARYFGTQADVGPLQTSASLAAAPGPAPTAGTTAAIPLTIPAGLLTAPSGPPALPPVAEDAIRRARQSLPN